MFLMPRTGITAYNLLLSCPGDVLDLKSTVESCVKSFNASIGEANNIRIDLKHWSTDGFSQSGDKPQNILNKQFVDDCDLCVALLGTRFGTPTDNYDSGTEEEIEKMLSQNKQVFLYFIERSVEPSDLDIEQYKKVQNFKEKYTEKGLYSVVKSSEELRTELQNALSMYFIKLVAPHISQQQSTPAPNLGISTVNDEKDIVIPFHTNYQQIKLVKDKETSIKSLIDKISATVVVPSSDTNKDPEPEISDEALQEMSMGDIMKGLESKKISQKQYYKLFGKQPPSYSKVVITDDESKLILDFCDKHSIVLNEDFYFLGNLQLETKIPIFTVYGGASTTYLGSESEQEKHQLLKELFTKIREYNHVVEYFSELDSMPSLSLVVENSGNTYDEDIDIKLFVEKNCVSNIDEIPKPGIFFLEEAVELDIPKHLFAGNRHYDIEDYSNYPVSTYTQPAIQLPFKSRDEEIAELQEEYQESLEYVFCYDLKETAEDDIFCFNIPYLKQNTKMFFPSYLFFINLPENIRYEIRSKHSPEVYRGILTIVKDVDN